MARVDIFLEKYYTDQHNVDEDLRTISNYGDAWAMGNWAGVTRRTMNDSPTTTLDDVASRQKINRTYSPCGDACSIAERQMDYICLMIILPLGYLLYPNILPPGMRIRPSAGPSFTDSSISTAVSAAIFSQAFEITHISFRSRHPLIIIISLFLLVEENSLNTIVSMSAPHHKSNIYLTQLLPTNIRELPITGNSLITHLRLYNIIRCLFRI